MSYTVEPIVEKTGAWRLGNEPATIDWLLTDSRSLYFPEETLFPVIPTKRSNGARYIPDLYEWGVRNFAVTNEDFKGFTMDSEQLRVTMAQGCNSPVVPNTLKVLQKLSE